MNARRCQPEEALDETNGLSPPAELVQVVENQDEAAIDLVLERFRQHPAEATFRGRGRGTRDGRQPWYDPTQRIAEPRGKLCRRGVVAIDRVPGAGNCGRPRAEERRLSVPGPRDDGRQAMLESPGQQRSARHVRIGRPRRQDLRSERAVHPASSAGSHRSYARARHEVADAVPTGTGGALISLSRGFKGPSVASVADVGTPDQPSVVMRGKRRFSVTLVATLALAAGAAVVGAGFAGSGSQQRSDATLGIHVDAKPGLSFDETERLLERFSALIDELPPTSSPVRQRDLKLWVREILPWFQTEGVVARVVVPRTLSSRAFTGDGFANDHLLAAGSCWFDSVLLNRRVFSPVSSWYGRPDFLATLVHELAHVQGICIGSDTLQVEASAQMAALEVMAAMANDGNEPMAISLLFELRRMCLDALEGEAWGNPARQQSVRGLDRRVMHNALAEARNAQAERYWRGSKERSRQLRDVLNSYAEVPLQRIVAALHTGSVWNIQLPINDPGRGGSTSGPLKRLRIDDLSYFLAHADAIVEDLAAAGTTPAAPAAS